MTLQQLYLFLYEAKPIVLLVMLLAPWIALGICTAVPGQKEEPFVLSFNLAMATLSLLLVVGYVWYVTQTAGLTQVVQDVDILLVLAPCYYVGVSLWVTRQRLPLSQVPAARAIQGLALIAAGYLGFVWLLSKLRIVLFSFLPLPFLLLLILSLLAVAYMGYQRITGEDVRSHNRSNASTSAFRSSHGSASNRSASNRSTQTSIDDELEALRRDLEND